MIVHPSSGSADWFEEWFNSDYYTRVYRHRNQSEASNVVDLLVRTVPLETGARILDLCCGSGRHSQALARRGFSVTGIDLSTTLLGMAREETADANVRFRQCDMRDPYPDAPYDCVANFFTSFGYFDSDSDNFAVLERVHEALAPGGYFFFDYLNAHHIRKALVPHDSKQIDNLLVVQRRELDDRFVNKTISITDAHDRQHSFTERVRLYDRDDFERMFARAGLAIRHLFGTYTGEPFAVSSPRLIIVARAV